MKAEYINPFVTAAAEVLNAETQGETRRGGEIHMDQGSETSREVTAIVGLAGDVRGMVLLGMDEIVARNIYGAMIEEDSPELDELAESALGELCNMITGQAAMKLADTGRRADLTPPTVVTGRGASLSTLTMPRLVIPLATRHGDVQIDIAINDA